MSYSLVEFFRSLVPTPRTTPKLFHIVLLASLVPLLFFLSVGASVGFYRAYVPQVYWKQKLYLQYGVSDNPFAFAQVPSAMILAGQRYDAFLDLFLAPTEANYALGNFMCNLTLTGRGGAAISSSRPAIVNAPSRILSIWPFVPPYHIVVPLMEAEALYTLSKPIVARVEIGRRDAWQSLGTHREVQTISSQLQIVAVLRGLRWWMYRYPVVSVMTSSCLFFLAACLIAGVVYVFMAPPLTAPAQSASASSAKQVEATPAISATYTPYGTHEEPAISLAHDMMDISAEPSIKSEEAEGEMSDWSDTAAAFDTRLPPIVSSESEGNQALRLRTSRTESTDSLSTLSGDVRRRLAQ